MPEFGRSNDSRPAAPDVAAVLSNVAWIVSQLDDAALDDLRDLPVLELAKHISVRRVV